MYERHGRKRDGTAIITEITLTTFVIGGEIYEQAIARDITQRKQMEGGAARPQQEPPRSGLRSEPTNWRKSAPNCCNATRSSGRWPPADPG
ncbi:MAG: hypothetical protein IPG64_19680 [Haliea sp.]|nr:hypothetical protein [Haliea sp.]